MKVTVLKTDIQTTGRHPYLRKLVEIRKGTNAMRFDIDIDLRPVNENVAVVDEIALTGHSVMMPGLVKKRNKQKEADLINHVKPYTESLSIEAIEVREPFIDTPDAFILLVEWIMYLECDTKGVYVQGSAPLIVSFTEYDGPIRNPFFILHDILHGIAGDLYNYNRVPSCIEKRRHLGAVSLMRKIYTQEEIDLLPEMPGAVEILKSGLTGLPQRGVERFSRAEEKRLRKIFKDTYRPIP